MKILYSTVALLVFFGCAASRGSYSDVGAFIDALVGNGGVPITVAKLAPWLGKEPGPTTYSSDDKNVEAAFKTLEFARCSGRALPSVGQGRQVVYDTVALMCTGLKTEGNARELTVAWFGRLRVALPAPQTSNGVTEYRQQVTSPSGPQTVISRNGQFTDGWMVSLIIRAGGDQISP